MRNNPSQTALPIRKWGSFLPGNGVGGAGVHWNGQTWRFLPNDFRIRSHMTERYGEGIMPEGNHIQDWPVSYEELEPYYDKFEYVAGISGKAGNIKGAKQAGGNPFEGARERDYPTPPMKQGYAQELFTKAASGLGLHPFPRPSANISIAYTNPYGCSMAPCTYCGFCERFGCANYSKASPQTCVLPALIREPTFEARTDSEVTKVNLSKDGKTATGVTYVDLNGEEWEQPADLVLVCAYSLFNVRLLLLSGIGKPYDPATNEGVVGRNYAYQTGSAARPHSSRMPSSIRSPRPVRLARRSTTTTATISTTARMVLSAGLRSPAPTPMGGRSCITRRRAARRHGAASGRRPSARPISASPALARKAA